MFEIIFFFFLLVKNNFISLLRNQLINKQKYLHHVGLIIKACKCCLLRFFKLYCLQIRLHGISIFYWKNIGCQTCIG